MCTTAGWSGVLQALTNDRPPDCDPTIKSPSNRGDCGNMAIAIPFLVSYLIISSLVVVRLNDLKYQIDRSSLGQYVHCRDLGELLSGPRRCPTGKCFHFCSVSFRQTEFIQGLTDDDYDMYYEKWQKLDPSGSQFIRYDQLSDFVDNLEPPLRIPKPNHLILVAMDLTICEDDRMHCVDILDALTKNFLGTLDTSTPNSDVPIDIKKDRPKDYHPISSTFQRQREHYLMRLGLKGFRQNVQRCRERRQNQEPILERAIIDELIELDDLTTPTPMTENRMEMNMRKSNEQTRKISTSSSISSFNGRSLSRGH